MKGIAYQPAVVGLSVTQRVDEFAKDWHYAQNPIPWEVAKRDLDDRMLTGGLETRYVFDPNGLIVTTGAAWTNDLFKAWFSSPATSEATGTALHLDQTADDLIWARGLETRYIFDPNGLIATTGAGWVRGWLKTRYSSTALSDLTSHVRILLRDLFTSTSGIEFETGMESDLASGVKDLVRCFADDATDALIELIAEGSLSDDALAEALKWLGQMYDPPTHLQRRRLLEYSLGHRSRYVRDAAVLGLASLDDPGALLSLVQARQHESISGLRRRIDQIISQLEETANGADNR